MTVRFPDAYAFLEGRRHGDGPIFVLGGQTDTRVTVVAQQRRALNIVAALSCVEGDELPRKTVAIVGAGASGVTAGAALSSLGVRVVLYDRAAAPLHAQRASASRFLHPNLFHWPEAGWDHEDADLPIGGWTAAYADDVRNQILTTTGSLAFRYCTKVTAVLPDGDRVRIQSERINERVPQPNETFDMALVATGFPTEIPPASAKGGSYWHALDVSPTDDLHVIGDGDGALTEVLMLYIDLLGHAAVVNLARRLPEGPELRRDDLIAQGQPDRHTPEPILARVTSIMRDLDSLDPRNRNVTIHAKDALKGRSFLLNRVLLHHLLWIRGSSVQVSPHDVDPAHLSSLGGEVIWRAGLGRRRMLPFEEPGLQPRTAVAAIASATPRPTSDPNMGVIVQAIDALRRRLWDEAFDGAVRRGHAPWSASPQAGRARTEGESSSACKAALPGIAATATELLALGVPLRADAYDVATGDICIETVARTISLPHDECVVPTGRSADVIRDDLGRLWFESPKSRTAPMRKAVPALVDTTKLRLWTDSAPKSRHRSPKEWSLAKSAVDRYTLLGLGDLSTLEPAVLETIWLAHYEREEFADAVHALLRRARMPSGRGGHSADVGTRTRASMLDVARVLNRATRSGPDEPKIVGPFSRQDRWMLLTAAIVDLSALGEAGVVQLRASDRFIEGAWASRVRAILRSDGAVEAPFTRLARTADRSPRERQPLAELRSLAEATLAELPEARLRPLALFGVVPSTQRAAWPDDESDTGDKLEPTDW